MNDPFYNLYSIITDSAIKQNFNVVGLNFPSLGDSDPSLLREIMQEAVEESNLQNWIQMNRSKLIFHDQEPIAFSRYREQWAERIYRTNRLNTAHLLSNSEINSIEKDQLLEESGWRDFYWFSNGFLALEWYRYYQYADYLQDQSTPRYLFSCYNRIIQGRPHRSAIAKKLLDLGNDKIILSYTGESGSVDQPIVINTIDHNRENQAHLINVTDFIDSFCHIVTERLFNEDRIHLTEKVFRPIVCCRPFVLASSPYALEYMRSYGFKTFSDFWDESYDNIKNHSQRLDAILRLIDHISKLDPKRLLQEMRPILLHNREHFYNGFRKNITQELFHNLSQCISPESFPSYYEKIIASLNDDEISFLQSSREICRSDDNNAFAIYLDLAKKLSNDITPANGIREIVRSNVKYITPFYQSVQLKKRKGLVI